MKPDPEAVERVALTCDAAVDWLRLAAKREDSAAGLAGWEAIEFGHRRTAALYRDTADLILSLSSDKEHLAEREAYFAEVLGVADAGRYRNDWYAPLQALEARATALSREVEGLREALQGMVTICVRVGPTTREDVDAIHKARAALSPPVDGGER